MEWTQAKINEWATQTFGKATPQHMIARAIQECSELLMEVTKVDIEREKIAEECADIIGPLCRVSEYAGCDITPVFDATDFIAPNQLYGPAVRVMEKLVFMMNRMGPTNIISNRELANLIGRTVMDLGEICASVGANLGQEVDKKMATLITRKWVLDGNGAGQHVKSFPMPSDRPDCMNGCGCSSGYCARNAYFERKTPTIIPLLCALGGACEPGNCARRPECPPNV